MTTLQAALKRGITQSFQIEESELVVEPLPDSNCRKSILFYEAAEGGAGVLSRLGQSPDQLGLVAREALRLLHFDTSRLPARFSVEDLTPLEIKRPDGTHVCEAGCYQCLLSYYNQPDHELINRRDQEVLGFLVRMAQAAVGSARKRSTAGTGSDSEPSPLLTTWQRVLTERGHRTPDSIAQLLPDDLGTADALYRAARALVMLRPVSEALRAFAADRGYSIIEFPPDERAWPEIFVAHADIFGPSTASNA